MSNAEWLQWFDRQTRDIRKHVMDSIDRLEADGVPGHVAHRVVRHAVEMSRHETEARILSAAYLDRN